MVDLGNFTKDRSMSDGQIGMVIYLLAVPAMLLAFTCAVWTRLRDFNAEQEGPDQTHLL